MTPEKHFLFCTFSPRTCCIADITSSLSRTFPSMVFVQKYGVNSTVCSAGWDDRDANVICREKGYGGGQAVGSGYYPSSRIPPKWFSSFNCTGTESRLTDCAYSQQPARVCQSSYMTARVFCYNANGKYKIFFGN